MVTNDTKNAAKAPQKHRENAGKSAASTKAPHMRSASAAFAKRANGPCGPSSWAPRAAVEAMLSGNRQSSISSSAMSSRTWRRHKKRRQRHKIDTKSTQIDANRHEIDANRHKTSTETRQERHKGSHTESVSARLWKICEVLQTGRTQTNEPKDRAQTSEPENHFKNDRKKCPCGPNRNPQHTACCKILTNMRSIFHNMALLFHKRSLNIP